MYHNDYLAAELTRLKQEQYRNEAAQDRLAAEYQQANPAPRDRRALVLLVAGAAVALLHLVAG